MNTFHLDENKVQFQPIAVFGIEHAIAELCNELKQLPAIT